MSAWEDDLPLRASRVGQPAHGGARWFAPPVAPEYGSWLREEPRKAEPDWPAIAERWAQNAQYEYNLGRIWYHRWKSARRALMPAIIMAAGEFVALVVMAFRMWGWM